MMPFKLFRPKETLPEELHPYIDLIRMCHVTCTCFEGLDRIAYLTVHESDVSTGGTQRRAGLHIESPRAPKQGGGSICKPDDSDETWRNLAWGMGHSENGWPMNGIYMASTLSDSCIVYPALVDDPHLVTDAHGALPSCARSVLGGHGRRLKAGELCWITDRTPHESLPLESSTHRQFFRLVVGPVGAWYSTHNTANPCGVAPDAPIVHEDKFLE